MNRTVSSMIGVLALSVSVSVHAGPVYDGFPSGTEAGRYAPGQNVSAATGGGVGWSLPAWADKAPRKMIAVPSGLTYSDGTNELATTPGALHATNAGGNAEIERDFPPFGAGAEAWFSVLMKRAPSAHGYEDRFAFQLRSQTGGLKYSIRALDGSKEWHASYVPQGSNNEELAALRGCAYDQPILVVGRISTIGSRGATFSVWANPKNLKELGEPTWTSPAFHAPGFGRVTLVTDGTREGFFDEVRFGSSKEEVVPLKSASP